MWADCGLEKDESLGSFALGDLVGGTFDYGEYNSIIYLDEAGVLIVREERSTLIKSNLLEVGLFQVQILQVLDSISIRDHIVPISTVQGNMIVTQLV